MQPSNAAVAEPRAGWMSNNQKVPAVVQDFSHVTVNMAIAALLSR